MEGSRRSRGRTGTQHWPLSLEHLEDRLVRLLGMLVGAGVGDTAIHEEGVQLGVALHPEPGREEALAHQTHLVLDLALLPTDAGVQAVGSIR